MAAVDLLSSSFSLSTIEEAAAAGIRSMEYLIFQLTNHVDHNFDCSEIADHTVSNFKKVISIFDRTTTTGHARFRRSPAPPPPPPPPPPPLTTTTASHEKPAVTLDFSNSANSSSFWSSITGDASVSNGKTIGQLTSSSSGGGKPPLLSSSSSHKKRCRSHGGGEERCHCSKKRGSREKRTVRVPAISSKAAEIPTDEFSWRKYGQKPIKGSPYPRGYYKCSTMRGCPARKHVDRAADEPSMLVVTYEGEHHHNVVDGAPILKPPAC